MGQLLLLHREQNFCLSITAATGTVSPVLDFFYYVVFTNPSTSPLLLLEISTGSTHIGPQDLTSLFNLLCLSGLLYQFLFNKRVKLVTLDCTQYEAEFQLRWL